jgi:phenylacetate-CoA ligase
MAKRFVVNGAEDIEYKSVEEIKAFQERLLAENLKYLNEKSPYYRRVFRENSIDISQIRHIEDLLNIPFTEKEDLHKYNDDFLCIDKADIVDYITTSGTLGDPVTFACSENDLQRLAYNEKKSFECAGLHHGSILQLMTTIDKRFMAGLAYFLGIRELGASIVRVGNGIPELQWDTIQRIHPDTLMCVPSFILKLIQFAEEHGIDYRNSSVKRIIGIGESLREQDFTLNSLGKKIKEKWDVDLFATYSSTEMSTTFPECEYGCGGHHHPELIIVEIIGDDDRPVKPGEPGEVVVTTLGVEAMPLLRFRTGDIASIHTEPCKCGRKSFRISPLVGRKNNMIKLKGTTLYPPAIFDVLNNTEYIENYVVCVNSNETATDDVIVRIGLKSPQKFDVEKDLKDRFRARIRVAPQIEILPADIIQKINYPAMSRKPILFIDNRNNDLQKR